MVMSIKPHDKDGDHDAGHHKLIRNFDSLVGRMFSERQHNHTYNRYTRTDNKCHVFNGDTNQNID